MTGTKNEGRATQGGSMAAKGSDRTKLGFHPSPELLTAFEKYQADQRPKVSITAALQAAVEEFLTARGYWPPEEESAPAHTPAKKGR